MSRTRRALIAAILAIFALALIALMPLALGLRLFGLEHAGLTARTASGSIWSGRLEGARLGPVTLGAVRTRLQLFPLLAARARLDLSGVAGTGGISVSPGSRGIDDVTAVLPLAAALGPLPVDRLALEDVSVRFAGGRCARAEGRIRATFSGPVAGLALPGGMAGTARCDGGVLALTLTDQSALETLTLRIEDSGRYRARLVIRAVDPTLAPALSAAGFRPAGAGLALPFSGTLG